MKRIRKEIINNLLVAGLVTGCLIIYVGNFASSTFFSNEYVLKKLDDISYYKKIYDMTYENFLNYIMQSGLEESVLKDIVTIEKIKSDTKIILDNFYSGLNTEVEVNSINEKLKENIRKYMEENDIKNQDSYSIGNFCDIISGQYLYDINTHSKQDENIFNMISSTKKLINKVKKIGFVIVGGILILLVIINTKQLYRIIALGGITSTFIGIVSIYANKIISDNVNINNLYFFNKPLSEAMQVIIKENIELIYNHGLILTSIGIITIILGNYINAKFGKEVKYKIKRHSHSAHREEY